MRRSRLVIVTLTAAALVALVVLIVKYGPLATAPSATLPSVRSSSTPSVVVTSSPTPTVSASPSSPAPPTSAPSPPPTPTVTAAAPAPPAKTEKRKVDVVVTYADWSAADSVVEAGAYATVVEEPGSCTLKLTSGGRSVTASITALTDASTMSCGGLRVPRDKLSSGTWTAVVIYESATSVGMSAPVEVVVP
ncbi:MAG: hypothetical protein HHJ14_10105 [Cellulomonas sp.]|nr:hypothetical protein [Cellulomonas sp.]